ncbi:MAG: hypothetical protein NTY71_03825 [Methanoregula sp.]|nr:hypothetical protein [Methanoregula sp.]
MMEHTKKTKPFASIFKSEWVALPIAILFIQSLLIAWFIYLILQTYEIPLVFRLIRGVGIIFVIVIPVFLVIEGFRYTTPTVGFFVPLFLYALTYPLFDSLSLHLNLFFDPTVMVPSVVGGIGFGIIGVGSYHLKRSILVAFMCATVGITLVFISSPDILQSFLYVIFGDPFFITGYIHW